MKTRLHYLDFLRFLSFGFIISYHMIVQLALDGVREMEEVTPFFMNANVHTAVLGVNLFLMISGAGLMCSYGDRMDVVDFYKRRFTRILIPFYFVWVVSFVLRYIQIGKTLVQGVPVWSILFTVAGMDEYWPIAGFPTFSTGVGEWFLGCLVMLYLVFPLLLAAVKRFPRITFLVSTAFYLYITWRYPFRHVAATQNVLTRFYPFLLGMLSVRPEKTRARKNARRLYIPAESHHLLPGWTLAITLPVVGFYLLLSSPLPLPEEWTGMIFSVSVYLIFMALEPVLASLPLLDDLMALFSFYSYEIFLVHHITIYIEMTLVAGQRITSIQLLIVFASELLGMAFGGWVLRKIEKKLWQ